MIPVIMAGGSGTRLWPLSRKLFPKQFHRLTGNYSMLQETILRMDKKWQQKLILVCNEEHRFIAAQQLQEIDLRADILLEPCGRNTAPAIALAAELIQKKYGSEETMLILAADHYIENPEAFRKAVNAANITAANGRLLTFGIPATSPETGYGYIEVAKENIPLTQAAEIKTFREKPDEETAKQFVKSGNYLWNSGMFLFSLPHFYSEMKKLAPEILECIAESMQNAEYDQDFIRPDSQKFMQCPAISIDYALMEKTQLASVQPLNAGWNDVGAWNSLAEVLPQDEQGNCFRGDVKSIDSQRSYVYSTGKLVSLLGVKDLLVVNTKDAVLIANRNCDQNVGEFVRSLQEENRPEADVHQWVHRPWGQFDEIDQGERFKVKKITVDPGKSLSLQMHHHRSEHWIVVSGTAKVTIGDTISLIQENESTYIPIGEKHSLENPGKIPLELIEVQVGGYLGEDDIVRYNDSWGRK